MKEGDEDGAPHVFKVFLGSYTYRHHVQPKVDLYVPQEGSFPTPLKYIDVVRRTNTMLGVMLEHRINDHRNVDGGQEPSAPWTGLTLFLKLNEKLPDRYAWSGKRLTKGQATSRTNDLWPEFWSSVTTSFQNEEKRHWTIEKPKLDNARRSGGVINSIWITWSSRTP